MNQHFAEFLDIFSPQVDRALPTTKELEGLRRKLPAALIEFWTTAGWSGYADGILWSTDPTEFDPALEAWLDGTTISKRDEYTVIARSAFGKLYAWGKNSGVSLIINPHSASIATVKGNFSAEEADTDISAFFLSSGKEDFDFEDFKDKPLFARALKKLGPLKRDEMYAVAPACGLGGVPKLENLIKEKIVPHLVLLAQISEIEFHSIDVTDI